MRRRLHGDDHRISAFLDALEALGKRYPLEYLHPNWDPERLRSDWFHALFFFLDRMYYQGRRDDLSEKYFGNMRTCLECVFGDDPTVSLERLWRGRHIPRQPYPWHGFDRDRSRLWRAFSDCMGKVRDREMVLDALRHVHAIPGNNVVEESLGAITSGGLAEYRATLRSLRQVGGKTSALFLRDVVVLYGCRLSAEEFVEIAPVDTWVRQVVVAARPELERADDVTIAGWLAGQGGHDVVLLNSGAWYLGNHAFPLLLGILSGGEISPEALERVELGVRVKPS